MHACNSLKESPQVQKGGQLSLEPGGVESIHSDRPVCECVSLIEEGEVEDTGPQELLQQGCTIFN